MPFLLFFLLLPSSGILTPKFCPSNLGCENKEHITAARYNPDTSEVGLQYADGKDVRKREAYYNYGYNDDLVDILRSKKQWGFCKSYTNLRPTMKKVVTVTACPGNPKCRPVTITKKKMLDAKTTMEEVPVTEETTITVTAETSSQTVDSVSTVTSTTTSTVVITSTVGTPLEPSPAFTGCSIRPPQCVSGYRPAQISSACSQLVKKVIRTRTYTQTKTVPGRARSTTTTVLVPQDAVRKAVTKTATKTTETTTTPVNTITSVSTTTEIESTVTTSTTTICPTPTYVGTNGVGVDLFDVGSNIQIPNVERNSNIVACCSACYYDIPDCNIWAAGPNYCFIVAGGSGPNPSSQCPKGQGGGILMVTPSMERSWTL
ncbi:hypothetical protein BDD12DRAFT_804574 [Trichophaea hybrida]|nr:hypothetical protein BDD12DRAFT_804574 [Trichophaea hybrida]